MNENTAIVIRIIKKYLRDLERSISMYHWNSPRFEQITYEMIAANTILDEIKTNKSLEPKSIIENFRAKMNEYIYVNEFYSRQYSIQADAATYILDEIEYEERKEKKSKWTNQNSQN